MADGQTGRDKAGGRGPLRILGPWVGPEVTAARHLHCPHEVPASTGVPARGTLGHLHTVLCVFSPGCAAIKGEGRLGFLVVCKQY